MLKKFRRKLTLGVCEHTFFFTFATRNVTYYIHFSRRLILFFFVSFFLSISRLLFILSDDNRLVSYLFIFRCFDLNSFFVFSLFFFYLSVLNRVDHDARAIHSPFIKPGKSVFTIWDNTKRNKKTDAFSNALLLKKGGVHNCATARSYAQKSHGVKPCAFFVFRLFYFSDRCVYIRKQTWVSKSEIRFKNKLLSFGDLKHLKTKRVNKLKTIIIFGFDWSYFFLK